MILKPVLKFLSQNKKQGCTFFAVHRTAFRQWIKMRTAISYNLSWHRTAPSPCPGSISDSVNSTVTFSCCWVVGAPPGPGRGGGAAAGPQCQLCQATCSLQPVGWITLNKDKVNQSKNLHKPQVALTSNTSHMKRELIQRLVPDFKGTLCRIQDAPTKWLRLTKG